MTEPKISCSFLCNGSITNRKNLFNVALLQAKSGKVLYILREELKELPELSQGVCVINSHFLKMITFLYVSNIQALIESTSSLPDWQNAPSTIILEDLGEYCDINDKHNACGVIALLLDATRSCSKHLKSNCNLYISINKDIVGDDYCKFVQEMYCVN